MFVVLMSLAVLRPSTATAQFEAPCRLACAGVLGTTAFVTATGVSIAVARATGGLTRVNQGLLVWGSTFTTVLVGGVALSGNGARQERAIYGAGIGSVVGGLAGLGLEALRTRGDGPRVVAGTLIGAASGALIGGVYAALTLDGQDTETVPLLSVNIPF